MVHWIYRTRAGLAQIVPAPHGFAIVFDGEKLEYHASPAAAAQALANGTVFWPSASNPSELGIPDDIDEWERIP